MKLLSWNIQWGRGADGRVDLARTVAAIRAAGDFDVICVQEVACNFSGLPGGASGDGARVLAQAFPGFTAVFGAAVDVPARTGGRALFGNLLLSRLPVGQVFRHLLPAPVDAGVPGMQRVCVEAVVEGRDGPLRVLTTHLEYYSRVQRAAQVRALRALQLEAMAHAAVSPAVRKESNPAFAAWPRPAAALLCGDFNCEPDAPDYACLQEAEAGERPWRDAWRVLHGLAPHAPTVGLHGAEWPDRAYCCDYFFVSAELEARVRSVRVEAGTAASDHQPVLLELDA